MTLHGLGSAEAAGGVTGTTFQRATANDTIVITPTLDGARAFKVDPVGGQPTVTTYGWQVGVGSQGSQRLMLVSAIIRLVSSFDEAVALMELGPGIFTATPTRQISISTSERLAISDKDEDDIGFTGTGYLAADINYYFLWLYDQRSLTNTLDILWVRKPAASVTNTTIAFVDGGGGADTITDSNNGFGIFTAGMIFTVSDSVSNDGTYTIVSVVAGTITLATGELTAESAGANVTVAHAEQSYKAIDVTDHGNGVDNVFALTMGTFTGKGPLPTTGGPFYFVNAVLQNLEKAPNGGSAEPKDDAKGSFACKVKMPIANGAFGDFDAGTGTNPDWNDVKEIPSDDATSYDEGDVDFAERTSTFISFNDANPDTIVITLGTIDFIPGATITVSGSASNDGTYTIDSISGSLPWILTLVAGDTLTDEAAGALVTITQAGDLQSYAIADAGGGEAVLAVQVVGAQSSDAISDVTFRPFIYDGTTRHNLPTLDAGLGWGRLNNQDVTLNQINGADLDRTLFNLLEAGLEILTVQNGKVLRVSQIGLEYAIPGPKPLPSDFPNLGAGLAIQGGYASVIG